MPQRHVGYLVFNTLADAKGDALAWAAHRAQWQALTDETTGRHNNSVAWSAQLFGKIESIFTEMVKMRTDLPSEA